MHFVVGFFAEIENSCLKAKTIFLIINKLS